MDYFRIPNTHKSCATCSNTQGAHVIHAYNLVFRLQDEIGDILDVEVNQNVRAPYLFISMLKLAC